jgi:rhodanese-related sulfurtransferase
MMKNGFKNVMVLDGGLKSWLSNDFPLSIQLVKNTNPVLNIKEKEITLQKVYEIVTSNNREYTILDVRSYQEYKDGHIKGALSIPYEPINDFVVSIEEQAFSSDQPLIIYCGSTTCDMGEKACDVLLRNGYTNVYHLKEGYDGWFSAKDYPIATAY